MSSRSPQRHTPGGGSANGGSTGTEQPLGRHPIEAAGDPEFAEGAAELPTDGVSRRRFMGLMGASAALAGTGLTGCPRRPKEEILPFADRPEDRIPGKPSYFATSFQLGGSVQGLVVEDHDGRPTKVEGNPAHSGSLGAASTWAQASVLDLYDPDRSRKPLHKGSETSWSKARSALDEAVTSARQNEGAGLALVVDAVMSPTQRRLLKRFREKHPRATVAMSDPLWPTSTLAGAELVRGPDAAPIYRFDRAETIVSLDSDLFFAEGDGVRHARAFADGRRVEQPGDAMNRLYAVGPVLDVTAAMGDHRLRMTASRVGPFAAALARAVADRVRQQPDGTRTVLDALPKPDLDERSARYVEAIAKDLVATGRASLVVAGERQPAWVHGVAFLLDTLLGADDHTIEWRRLDDRPHNADLATLAERLRGGDVDTVVLLGSNPVYDATPDLKMGEALGEAKQVFHAGRYVDESARKAGWHLPVSHYLEAWGDLQAFDGTVSIVQPLIAPLHGTPSVLELTARVTEGEEQSGHDLVRKHWNQALALGRPDHWRDWVEQGMTEHRWRDWLHRGVADVPDRRDKPSRTDLGTLAQQVPGSAGSGDGTEVVFVRDATVLDGRFANNAWLQELPDPMTKIAWENVGMIAPSFAQRLGVESGDYLEVALGGASIRIPANVTPGVASDTIALPLGYGREELGEVAAEGGGVDVNALRSTEAFHFAGGAKVKAAGGRSDLASTQNHDSLVPRSGWDARPFVREATAEEYANNPTFVDEYEALPKEELEKLEQGGSLSIEQEPALTGDQQWGMAIDLNSCIGCNACTIACQAENNIPVVGRERVREGYDMHWIRIDRYYKGEDEDPEARFEPMTCQQCENAPCETVCPVAATVHSPEGLNDMAYNRCIGTRYCSNNCPFKVRRFNYFNYNHDIGPLEEMQKNPDVTIRFRGVMEKCTYCVQRINKAKIEAKVDGDGIVPDGAIKTACQQTCPTGAIVFGDIADPNSRVSQLKAQNRDYGLLRQLNIRPRTSYLAKLRNPNPELG